MDKSAPPPYGSSEKTDLSQAPLQVPPGEYPIPQGQYPPGVYPAPPVYPAQPGVYPAPPGSYPAPPGAYPAPPPGAYPAPPPGTYPAPPPGTYPAPPPGTYPAPPPGTYPNVQHGTLYPAQPAQPPSSVVVLNMDNQRPPSNLALAICGCFCCWCCGLYAVIKSVQSNKAADRGDMQHAEQAGKDARTWGVVSIVCGIIASIIYIAMQLYVANNVV